MTDLKRSVSSFLLILYGLGTILGAGIYVLTGVVAGKAGIYTPLAFLIAALVASPTAFAYAELSTRYPQSAGEAVYVDAAFKRKLLTRMVGLMVAFIGIVSAATIARGFVGYLDVFIELPAFATVIATVLMLGGLAAYGILESVAVAAVITVIEILGLLLIIGTGIDDVDPAVMIETIALPEIHWAAWSGVLAGAFLAFYAFIGFEDIVNIAEETRQPEKALPFAILGSLAIATLLYFMTAMVAIASVPTDELASSTAPMSYLIEQNSGMSPVTITLISMLAVVNGALVQMIMASRVLFGMARIGSVPAWLGHVHEHTRTPIRATVVVVAIVLLLALAFDVETLAGLTSAFTLIVFAAINAALIVVKRRGLETTGPSYPMVVPVVGLMTCILLFVAFFIEG